MHVSRLDGRYPHILRYEIGQPRGVDVNPLTGYVLNFPLKQNYSGNYSICHNRKGYKHLYTLLGLIFCYLSGVKNVFLCCPEGQLRTIKVKCLISSSDNQEIGKKTSDYQCKMLALFL